MTDEFFDVVGTDKLVPTFWLCNRQIGTGVGGKCGVVLTNSTAQASKICKICDHPMTKCSCGMKDLFGYCVIGCYKHRDKDDASGEVKR
jgi:hypothetical protein